MGCGGWKAVVDGTGGIVAGSTAEGASVGVDGIAVALLGTKEEMSVVGRGVTDGSAESEETYVEFGCGSTVESVGRAVGNPVVDETRELVAVGSGETVEAVLPLDVDETSDEVGYGCEVVKMPVE